ncbi:MAG: dihydroorotase [Bacteriovoracaceae bacterium]|nr:dihydroorotase [Bacteriovoracaceae bacterium]
MATYDVILKNIQAQLPSGIKTCNVGIENGKIASLEASENDSATTVIDGTGKHLLPGVIDSQVHFREPGLTHKEDLESGSRSAACGGVTTFLEMPNTNPSTTTAEAIAKKVELAKSKSHTHFGFFIGATGENLDELLKVPTMEGCCGIKIFLGSSTGDLLLYNKEKLLEVFKGTKSMIAVHSENEEMLKENKSIQQNATDVHAHYKWRDVETAFSSTTRVIEIAKEAGRKVHVLHITSKKEIEFLKDNKDFCTVEVTPQHLTLFAPDIYNEIGTYAQMNPPIRTKENTDALWVGLENGTVDVIGSDHAPHTKEEKDQGYPKSPSGMPGVQTMLPIMLDHVNKGRLSLEKCVQLLSENPAKLYGLETKGKIQVGLDADLVMVDLTRKWTVEDSAMMSKVGWTPFKGKEIQGWPEVTIISGVVVARDGKIVNEEFKGSPIR